MIVCLGYWASLLHNSFFFFFSQHTYPQTAAENGATFLSPRFANQVSASIF